MSYITLLLREEDGQGMVEYALILALIALAAISALAAMGTEVVAFFNRFLERLSELIP